MEWKPKTFEDSLLFSYWEKAGGVIFLEVPIGGASAPDIWDKGGSQIRRIDGVHIPSESNHFGLFPYSKFQDEFIDTISKASVINLIEVKNKLNRLVIGQALVGKVMFERQYQKPVQPFVLCHINDSAMSWSCEQLGIGVEII